MNCEGRVIKQPPLAIYKTLCLSHVQKLTDKARVINLNNDDWSDQGDSYGIR